MIAFNLRLLVRSMRWLGPALIALTWMSFTATNSGAALGNAGNSFMMLVAVTCWITIAVGNVDDDGHRELLTAVAGSPARLQWARAIAAFFAGNAIGVVITVVDLASGSRPAHSVGDAQIIGACVLLQLAATAIGVGIGTLLHRPVLRNTGVALLGATGALVALILLPPMQHVLRQLNDDRTGGLIVLTVVAIAASAIATAASGVLADRLN